MRGCADSGWLSPTAGRRTPAPTPGASWPALVRVDADGRRAAGGAGRRGDAELEAVALTADRRAARAALERRAAAVSELTCSTSAHRRRLPVARCPATWSTAAASSADGIALAAHRRGPGRAARGVLVTADDRPGRRRSAARGSRPRSLGAPHRDRGASRPGLPRAAPAASADGLAVSGWLYRPARRGPWPDGAAGCTAGRRRRSGRATTRCSSRWWPRASRSSRRTCAARPASAARFVNADNVAAAVRRHRRRRGLRRLPGRQPASPTRRRVGCMGRSYGGYLTLAALVTLPGAVRRRHGRVRHVRLRDVLRAHRAVDRRRRGLASTATRSTDAELLRDLSPITPDRPAPRAADGRARRERQQRAGDRGRAGGGGAGGDAGCSTGTCCSRARATSCWHRPTGWPSCGPPSTWLVTHLRPAAVPVPVASTAAARTG